jgi:hypothetical protein
VPGVRTVPWLPGWVLVPIVLVPTVLVATSAMAMNEAARRMDLVLEAAC